MWESRERRKAKDHDKDYEKEELKKEEMVSTNCHVIIILSSVLNHAFPPEFRSERGGIWQSFWKITMTRKTTRDTTS